MPTSPPFMPQVELRKVHLIEQIHQMVDVKIDVVDPDDLAFFFLFEMPIPERVHTSCARDQDAFGIDHFIIFMGWTRFEGVRFGIAMDGLGMVYASDARMC